jgi:hypothetical protein
MVVKYSAVYAVVVAFMAALIVLREYTGLGAPSRRL